MEFEPHVSNLGATDNSQDIIKLGGLSAIDPQELQNLSAEFAIAFNKFADRIGLKPEEVGYRPARNPMGYKHFQRMCDIDYDE